MCNNHQGWSTAKSKWSAIFIFYSAANWVPDSADASFAITDPRYRRWPMRVLVSSPNPGKQGGPEHYFGMGLGNAD